MCELLGLSFSQPISADFSMREFERRDEENPDGWGLGWYPDQSLAIAKEPIEWGESKFSGFLENYQGLQSRIYIGHVRHKTTGGNPTRADTHPFGRELSGREYCFAHNGTLTGPFWELPLERFRPIGHTDSERLFCFLLEEIARREDDLAGPESWEWLHGRLADCNRWGKLNCLFSDGRRLFCYHDVNGWKGLSLRSVFFPDREPRSFGDRELAIGLESLESLSVNHGFVVASRPLSLEGWSSLHAGEFVVLEDGVMRYSSHRQITNNQTTNLKSQTNSKS